MRSTLPFAWIAISLWSLSTWLLSAPSEPQMHFHLLRAPTTDGFTELQFFPDGKLLEYNYTTDFSESRDDVPVKFFVPRFSVRSLRWKINGNQLSIQRGDDVWIHAIMEAEKYVYLYELTWDRVDSLLFFHELDSYCGRSQPKPEAIAKPKKAGKK